MTEQGYEVTSKRPLWYSALEYFYKRWKSNMS
jgi:hypothetical protein